MLSEYSRRERASQSVYHFGDGIYQILVIKQFEAGGKDETRLNRNLMDLCRGK